MPAIFILIGDLSYKLYLVWLIFSVSAKQYM